MAAALDKLPSSPVLQVTVAKLSDAGGILAVVNQAYRRDFFRFPERARTSLEKIQGYFSDPEHTWYVIRVVKNNVSEIACAVLYSTDKAQETRTEGNIHMLSARKEYWGQKMSALLLKQVEERAQQDKKTKIRLIVAITNIGLIRLYAKKGYRITGERFELPTTSVQPKYQKKKADGSSEIYCLHMEKELRIQSRL